MLNDECGADTGYDSRINLGVGTPHKKVCSDIYTGVGTLHTIQNQGGQRTRKCVQTFTHGWGHSTELKKHVCPAGGRVGLWVGGLSGQ